MTDRRKSKRMGAFHLKFREADGGNRRVDMGALFDSQYPGSYGVSFTLPTEELNDEGYPLRERIVAVKTESGKTLDISEAFLNFTCYDAMEARPPREE